jgi:hypothetical protein
LHKVSQALKQGGFGDASLLAPLSARARDSAHFTTSGFIGDPGEEGMAVEVRGQVQKGSDANTARLTITAQVHWTWGTERSQSVFGVETELLAQVGDYIILAVAPSAGVASPALALVVRVDRG